MQCFENADFRPPFFVPGIAIGLKQCFASCLSRDPNKTNSFVSRTQESVIKTGVKCRTRSGMAKVTLERITEMRINIYAFYILLHEPQFSDVALLMALHLRVRLHDPVHLNCSMFCDVLFRSTKICQPYDNFL